MTKQWGLTFDKTKATELGMSSPTFYVWGREEYNYNSSYTRNFYSDSTKWITNYRYSSSRLAVCVD